MDKYTAPVKPEYGGSPIHQWYVEAYAENKSWTDDEPVEVVGADGQPKKVPRSDVAILFNDYRMLRKGNTDITSYYSSVGSNCVTATPIALVSGSETFVAAFSDAQADKNKHALTKTRPGWKPWTVQPVPRFTSDDDQNIRTQTVMQQNARAWLSCGENNIDMSDQHVANMFVCQQVSLLDQFFTEMIARHTMKEKNDTVLENVVRDLVPTILHFESARSYFEVFPDSRRPVEGLCYADFTASVLQRVVAAYLVDFELTTPSLLRMGTLMIRRCFKHYGYDADFQTTALPNLMAITIFSKHLPTYLSGKLSLGKLAENLFDEVQMIEREIESFDEKTVDETNIRVFHRILSAHPAYTVDEKVTEQLYRWYRQEENYLKDFPFEDKGLIEVPETEFDYQLDALKIKGRLMFNRSSLCDEKGHLLLRAKSPAEWSGMILKTPGRYTLRAKTIGDAHPRRSGHDWSLVCALNITTGKEVLPVRKEGVADSGDYYSKEERSMKRHKKRLDLDQPIEILIEQKEYTVFQGGKVYHQGKATKNELLLVYKNLQLDLDFRPVSIEILKNARYKRLLRRREFDPLVDGLLNRTSEFTEVPPKTSAGEVRF